MFSGSKTLSLSFSSAIYCSRFPGISSWGLYFTENRLKLTDPLPDPCDTFPAFFGDTSEICLFMGDFPNIEGPRWDDPSIEVRAWPGCAQNEEFMAPKAKPPSLESESLLLDQFSLSAKSLGSFP